MAVILIVATAAGAIAAALGLPALRRWFFGRD